jgi:hypothetical protein
LASTRELLRCSTPELALVDKLHGDENAKRKASGEKRILKSFPTDPRLTWDEWRKSRLRSFEHATA